MSAVHQNKTNRINIYTSYLIFNSTPTRGYTNMILRLKTTKTIIIHSYKTIKINYEFCGKIDYSFKNKIKNVK